MSFLLLYSLAIIVPGQQQAPPPEVRKVVVTPQVVPVPAFRYVLLPPLKEKTSGNAVQLYYRCFAPEVLSWMMRDQYRERLVKWLELPYDEAAQKNRPASHPSMQKKSTVDGEEDILPANREEASVGTSYRMLDDLDQAARRSHAEWEYLERIKKSGIYMLMPDMSGFYYFNNIVHTRARLALMEGDYTRCFYKLQTGLAMALHLNETNLMVGSLTGNAIARNMVKVLFECIQTPQAPNLYWALSDLPQPFLDFRKSFAGDRMAIEHTGIDWTQLQTRIYTKEEIRKVVDEHLKQIVHIYGAEFNQDFTLVVLKELPRAKAWLRDQGRSAEDIEKMTSTQTVLLYAFSRYQHMADEYQKILQRPLAEKLKHAEAFSAKFQGIQDELSYYLGMVYFRSYPHVWVASCDLDRDFAILRCIEALRHHAAVMGGKLPASWDELRDLPVPLDPANSQPFAYQRVGNHAVITVDGFKGANQVRQPRSYEIHLR
ncbi:MAG TPA: hypothetical protein PLN21_04850 [Gemmatales bacterium]|nr:hypothetical protein [Gemmatales bacterium]